MKHLLLKIFGNQEDKPSQEICQKQFPLELFQLLKSGEKTLKEIHFKLKKDCWPPNVTQEEANKNLFRQFPEALRGNPKAQGLFTKSELEEILPEGAEILASKD